MEELQRLEREFQLKADSLTYQQRCSRIAAVQKGEEWTLEKKTNQQKRGGFTGNMVADAKLHPLFGKTLLIAPLMVPDAKRNLAYDEKIGHEIEVKDASAGEMIYGAPEEVNKMVGDYVVVSENRNRPIYAKTTFPKIGTEITYTLGTDLVPVCRGNDGQRGYIWSFPTSTFQVEDTMIQMYGLKTIIEAVYPELLKEFSGKDGKVDMMYIDGVTLAASIPDTTAILKEQRHKELVNVRAGLV